MRTGRLSSNLYTLSPAQRAELDAKANGLSEIIGLETIEGALERGDRAERMLALAVLSKLPPSETKRTFFLRALTGEKDLVQLDAVDAAAVLEGGEIRELLDPLLAQRIRIINGFDALLPLLGIRGNEADLEWLESAAEVPNISRALVQSLEQTQSAIERKLRLGSAGEQKAWEESAFTYWQLHRNIPNFRGIWGSYVVAAREALDRGVELSLEYVRYKLEMKDPLAAVLVGVYDLKELYEEIEVGAEEDDGFFGSMCERVLLVFRVAEEKEL